MLHNAWDAVGSRLSSPQVLPLLIREGAENPFASPDALHDQVESSDDESGDMTATERRLKLWALEEAGGVPWTHDAAALGSSDSDGSNSDGVDSDDSEAGTVADMLSQMMGASSHAAAEAEAETEAETEAEAEAASASSDSTSDGEVVDLDVELDTASRMAAQEGIKGTGQLARIVRCVACQLRGTKLRSPHTPCTNHREQETAAAHQACHPGRVHTSRRL